MAAEVKLEPGWLIKDVRKASDRLNEWASAKSNQSTIAAGQKHYGDASDESSHRDEPSGESR